MFEAKIIVADFKTSLATKIIVGGTTGSIQNNLDDDGVALPTGKYYFTIDADSAQKEHLTCTLTGKNMTNIKSVSRQGVETTGLVREHRIGASVSITDFAHIKMINDWAAQYDGHWEGAVANFAALSTIVGVNGEARVTLDDSKLYIYDTADSTWHLAGAGGGAGTVYRTTLLGTEATGDDNKTFTMTSGSFSDKKYLQVYKNGVLMGEGATNDYVATGSNQVVFNDVVLDDDVITLLVVSVDLYNPAWNNVNDDVLPDTTETHSIGSTLKKFTTAFFSGIVTALSFSGNGANLDDGYNGKLTSGTTANKLVRLDTDAQMPAVKAKNILIGDNANTFSSISSSNTRTIGGDGVGFGPSSPLSYTKNKEILFNDVSGVIKVTFTLNSTSSGSALPYARIYKNDVAVGTERTAFGTYSEDVVVSQGDKIQIYVKVGGGNTQGWIIHNFILQYDKVVNSNSVNNTVNL